MTVKRKLTVFIISYVLLGIAGIIFSGGTLQVLSHTQADTSVGTDPSANLRLADTAELDEAVMMLCQDEDNTFYQYPIVKDVPTQVTIPNSPLNTVQLTLSKSSHRIHHRKNSCILKMSMVVEDKEDLPVITDNLDSKFRIHTKESADGDTVMYIRCIFKGDIPQNYVLRIGDQEIFFN